MINQQKNVIKILLLLLICSNIQSVNAQAVQSSIVSPFKQPAALSTPVKQEQISGQVEKKDVAAATMEKAQVNPLLNPNNPLGITSAENNITKTYNLIKSNKLNEAKAVIVPTVNWLTDATEFHAGLYKTLKDISTAKSQADFEKDLALQFAVLRDKASYQLALLYIEEKNHKKAVEKLVDVVMSQPKTQLGFSAYQVLQQIGFTDKVQLSPSENVEDKAE